MVQSVYTVVIIGATTTSVTLSVTGVGLIVVRKNAGTACTLSLGNKVLHQIRLNKQKKQQKDMKKINKLLNLLIN